MFCMLKKKKYILFQLRNSSNHEKQVILFTISNREKQLSYLAVKKAFNIIKKNNFKTML